MGAVSRPSRIRSIDSEGVIVIVRWIAVFFATFQTIAYYRPIPSAIEPWLYATIAAFACANVALTLWGRRLRRGAVERQRRTDTPDPGWVLLGRVSIAVDVLFSVALCWCFAFDAATAIFIVLYLPPLEAALRFGMRGAISVMLVEAVAYTARDIWASSHYDLELFASSISFRMGVGLLIAAMGGAMADRYERAHHNIRRALDHEREAVDALRSLDDLRSTFLAAVSHELRTPLTSILGFSLTIQQTADELEPDTREMLRYVVQEARQLERLLQDLLDIERTGRGGVSIDRHPVDIAMTTRRLAQRLEQRLGRRVDVQADVVIGIIDEPKAERIIDNLLSNAIKYSPQGSEVRVNLARDGEGIKIVVEDEGPGVPEALRATIFQPFERGLVTSAHQPGTGIGLSLVDRFARLHGGQAWVSDRDGHRGSAFHVYLPDGPEGHEIATLSE